MARSLNAPSADAFCTSSQTTRADLIARCDDTKIMSNQVYYILARVGADTIGLYVESPDFDSAYDVAEERIAQRYTGPFTVQALQLIDVGKVHLPCSPQICSTSVLQRNEFARVQSVELDQPSSPVPEQETNTQLASIGRRAGP